MAGLIKQAMPAGAPDPEDQTEPPEPAGGPPDAEDQGEAPDAEDLTPQSVRAKMQVPPQFQNAYQRVVLAGMKIMFSPQTHQMALKTLQGPGPVEQRLAQAIAALMGTLIKQSNNTMPPQIVIPAGIELLVSAADFLKKSGTEPITPQQIATAVQFFIAIVMKQAGADDPQKAQALAQAAQSTSSQDASAPPDQGAAPPTGGPPAATSSPPGGGIVGQQMGG